LTPAQAALLVALPQAPSSRRPDRSPDRAEAGRARVLRKAVVAEVLDADTAAAAARDPVPRTRTDFPTHAAHLSDRLRTLNPLAGQHVTTLDLEVQRSLENLAAQTVAPLDPSLSAAIVVADHRTGAILAHVGAANYTSDDRAGWVDMTSAKRSPGSTLKPFVYGLGFDLGVLHPRSIMDDRPMTFSGYAPGNFDGRFRGPVRADAALQMSLNIPAIALTEAIGPARLLARIRRAEIDPTLQNDASPGLAVALGGLGVTLEELTTLFGALARGGRAIPLSWDATVPTPAAASHPMLSRSAAVEVTRILSAVPPPAHGVRHALAYKTGTSYGHRDALAIGYTGRFVAAVWLGRADSTAVPGLSGAEHAAPILFEALQRADPKGSPLPPIPEQASLPNHLQQFATASPGEATGAPALVFPPDGTIVAAEMGLTLKVRRGTPPFTWLINDNPAVVGTRRRATAVPSAPLGPARIAVIDATGRVDSIDIVITR